MTTTRERPRAPDAFWGMAIFLLTDAVMFTLLLVANLYLRRTQTVTETPFLSASTTLWFSLALWGSSLTLVLAERSPRRRAAWFFLLTAVLGAVFLWGQVQEYNHLLAEGVNVSRDLFFTGFFTLTGLHGLHVLLGLPLLLALALLRWRHELTEKRRGFTAAVSLYWHFVDAVWIVLYFVLYLWKPA